jgi:hypothetical protein
MLKILRSSGISKPISWILLFSFLIAVNGCYYFKVTRSAEPPASAIIKFQDEHKSVYIHLDDKVWHLFEIKINEENISGVIENLSSFETIRKVNPDGANRYRKNDTKNESEILNEVHIYVKEFVKNDSTRITFPVTAVDKIEVYDKATGATVASWTLSAVAIAGAAFGIFIIILLLTKESCPFIYTYNGNDFIFTGEIFSGATQPGLERDDYMLLPLIVPDEGTYKIKIANEVKEVQSINLAELVIVDHPESQSVLIDKKGMIHSFTKPLSPVSARDAVNTDILPLLKERDSILWSGNIKNPDKSGSEEITLKFIKPKDAVTSKLIIRAKNSFWLDGLVGKINELFGGRYDNYMKKQEGFSGKKLQKWQTDQKMPLSIYVEKNNRWKFADYFNLAGPMALKDDILELNLDGIESDTVKIKLETGFLFWEIDFAAMDFSKTKSPVALTIPVKTAVDNNGKDIKNLLLRSDNEYYVQPDVGNEAELIFEVPQQKEPVRNVFLHSRGHYRILREQSGIPDIKILKTFRRPGRVPEFSKETFDKLKNKGK